jgi:hypothetical protein
MDFEARPQPAIDITRGEATHRQDPTELKRPPVELYEPHFRQLFDRSESFFRRYDGAKPVTDYKE